MTLSEQSMSLAAGYRRKQLINAENDRKERQEKMVGNKSPDIGSSSSQCTCHASET
jgi:hypothetical protein